MQLEEEGKDPIEDLPDRLAQLERERSKKAKLESDAKSESEKKLDDDIKDFKEKYPKVNLAKLFEDKTFSKFSEGKLGRETTLATIYQDYLELKETFTGVKEVDDSHSPKKKGSSPSASGGHTSEKTSFSQLSEAEQIKLLKKQGML